jgi:glyoxylase-like metal-dependent hydrolase (beta-lactamase superfamily II)
MLEDVKLLSAGFCVHPEFMSIRGGAFKPCRFPAGFVYLQHRHHGAVLFDTGYSDHFHHETRAFPAMLYARMLPPHFEAAERACDQLRGFGVAPADVRAVVVSHFHADHIAGLRDFPKAEIVAARDGYAAIAGAGGLRGLLQGLLPGLMPGDAHQRMRFIDTLPPVDLPAHLSAFGSGRDLFGDGSAILIGLPGHSVGQVGLFLPETRQGALLLVADAAWSLEAVQSDRPPPWPVMCLLGQSGAYRTTLRKLSAVHHAAPDLAIRPSHCRHLHGASS